ncbi:AMP-binding protein [Trinickia caryophylli]|uniref:Acyl-coenzyme A synthetase/AMP-(Fatty) acid ligase n=1 Tax=Trinickia caryophylli TaxID=28094 RepID=A0A1X7CEA3_TRICW|nr:AMP-binding protein [Trinickia caryophylli]PMS12586.1 beta-hydroxyacyl-ACP dehydratase [Trinickia caryophylli]TRX19791.1 AMP-binding protein [Trinickia caryophylli]WQE12880.1 AMP-binding protein [Trinickia caryophylli]SME95225.1 Acyl-coenzyme A synthetase/AMP-(fatty) acid ligase [Trinickia caryophylli]GLU30603.1 AMP-ligase [Trinickia caryophylli]
MPSFPLVSHSSPDRTIAWRDGAPVTVRAFLAEVSALAAALPCGDHVFNVCKDRYRFTVGLCATLVAGKVSLLPSTYTPQTVRQLQSFAPDAFCLHDADDCSIDLPRFRYPEPMPGMALDDAPAPEIDGARVMAYVFTSGSTGTPVPHRKTWGFLVKNVRAAAVRLGLSGAVDSTIVGTVPPQHMYGFESTVLLALIGSLAFSNGQPFYPGDIRAELEAVPAPRILVTSPIHLRALLASEPALPRAALILSATAPLSEKLAAQAEARLHAPLMEIYGSTETGQIATRRTARGAAWQLFPEVTLTARAALDGDRDDDGDGPDVWAAGGHVETPVRMGDALELLDDSHFLLHGRKADLVNIAGKRTSLAYLNHQLTAIPGVDDGAFFMPDVTEASGRAHDVQGKLPVMLPVTRLVALVVAPTLCAADVQRALRDRIDAAFMPRPLLFVDALPRNGTGKLPHDTLAPLVATLLARPSGRAAVGEARTDATTGAGGTHAPIVFEIPGDHPALPGHFPGRPIVPGVVLLDYAIERIGAALARPLDALHITSAKFTAPTSPGEALALSFARDGRGAIRFTISAGGRTAATGVLSERQQA